MKKLNCFFTVICLSVSLGAMAFNPVRIPLYDGAVPNNKATFAVPTVIRATPDTVYANVNVPTLTICLPETPNASKAAVIVCPGGGYGFTSYTFEGTRIARELNKQGIAAFIVNYRIPNAGNQENFTIAPLQDAQRAIQYVRENADRYHVAADKIGIMGFSAGGHLASTAGTHFAKAVIDNPHGTSLRPDFMILAYPVISMSDKYCHKGSRQNLLGKNPSRELIEYYSNDLQVTSDTPPAFIVQCTDDSTVPVENSILFYEALLGKKVPVEMHLYVKGNHCFVGTPTTDEWMGRCFEWMKTMKYLQ
jgi:acetyl esterase/lipase